MAQPTTQQQAQTRQTVWTVDPAHTLVEFAIKHMMVTNVKGRFTKFSGTITGDLSDPKDMRVDGQIDAASIDTGNEQRDNHLRSADFFDVEPYPTIDFKSTRVAPHGKDRFTVWGDLTVHGTTREVELDVEFNGLGKNPYGKTVAGFTAETSISRKEWGLTWNVALEQGGWLVADRVKVTIEGQAAREDQ